MYETLCTPRIPDEAAMARCRARWDGVAKPLNGLGQLEDIICRMAGLTGTDEVCLDTKSVLVLCADNGVVARGVTQSDASVTAAVARSIAMGRGNVCRMAEVAGARVIPVDVGMEAEVDHPGILVRKIMQGTGDISRGPAMEKSQALALIRAGMELVRERKELGDRLIATGEMGIGNTTTSSAMASVLLGMPPQRMTGRGAGLPPEKLRHKIRVIDEAIRVNDPDPNDPLDVLHKLGGCDIAAMAGVCLGGARYGVPILLDGFISGVAALVALLVCPGAKHALFATHVSREPAGRLVLDALELRPLVYADMALGEGTGAVTVMPMLDMALAVYKSGSTFKDIQISAYKRFSEES